MWRKTRQATARPGCMGFPVHRRCTPELLGLTKGRKDVGQWTRDGTGVSRGEAPCRAQGPSVPPLAPHRDYIRREGLTLPGVWCKKLPMLCPQMKVTPPCSLENAHLLIVTRDLCPKRTAESSAGATSPGSDGSSVPTNNVDKPPSYSACFLPCVERRMRLFMACDELPAGRDSSLSLAQAPDHINARC